MRARTLGLLAALTFGTAACTAHPPGSGGAQPTQSSMERSIDAAFEDVYSRYRLPGLALGVVRDGEIIYTRTAGEMIAGSGQRVDNSTIFKIASNSKAMTTGVLARLVDAGKLRWEDPVTRYLPQFRMHDPWVTREMQVRDLLLHNSGLREGAGDLMFWPEPNSVHARGRHRGAGASEASSQLSLALRLRQLDVRRRGRSCRCRRWRVVRRARAARAVRAAADEPLPGRRVAARRRRQRRATSHAGWRQQRRHSQGRRDDPGQHFRRRGRHPLQPRRHAEVGAHVAGCGFARGSRRRSAKRCGRRICRCRSRHGSVAGMGVASMPMATAGDSRMSTASCASRTPERWRACIRQ